MKLEVFLAPSNRKDGAMSVKTRTKKVMRLKKSVKIPLKVLEIFVKSVRFWQEMLVNSLKSLNFNR